MKTSQVFTNAAKVVAAKGQDFACIALWRECVFGEAKLTFQQEQALENRFAEFFKPEKVRQHRPWWSGRHGKCREQRVLALLFMAAMYESEGD